MSDDRRFALGCFRGTAGPDGLEALFGLPAGIRRLAGTTGSFTRALQRHTGQPVTVRRLAEGWRDHRADRWPVPRVTRVWERRVRLQSAEARVEALTEVVGPLTPRLHRAITGLADAPLMEVLARQPLCRRQQFEVSQQGRRITRVSVYRIHLARVRVTEWFDIDLR
ncbi:chorismate--pyruvate lyase family protein [Guyparkeria sp.]|uniref:chorismate--pyruvate lyase family protein n=1 Tax=Guyparkeria sp. TaxID=2035736 RepID=UPI00397064DB